MALIEYFLSDSIRVNYVFIDKKSVVLGRRDQNKHAGHDKIWNLFRDGKALFSTFDLNLNWNLSQSAQPSPNQIPGCAKGGKLPQLHLCASEVVQCLGASIPARRLVPFLPRRSNSWKELPLQFFRGNWTNKRRNYRNSRQKKIETENKNQFSLSKLQVHKKQKNGCILQVHFSIRFVK